MPTPPRSTITPSTPTPPRWWVHIERVSNLLFQKPFSWGVGFELLATAERPAAVDGLQEERQTYFIAALPVRGLIDSTR